MVKININSFDRIITYGCSFTAGDELFDHEILNMSFDECFKLKQSIPKVEFTKQYPNVWSENFKKAKNYTWSAQIAKLLNKPFVNNSFPGSSIHRIYNDIITDKVNGLITDRDLVLVGLTTYDRVFNIDGSKFNTKWLSTPSSFDSTEQHKHALELLNDDYLFFTYYTTLYAILSLNIKNLYLQPLNSDLLFNNRKKNYNISDITLNYLKYIDTDPIMKERVLNPVVHLRMFKLGHCGYNHPVLKAHETLAKYLIQNFTDI